MLVKMWRDVRKTGIFDRNGPLFSIDGSIVVYFSSVERNGGLAMVVSFKKRSISNVY